MTTIEAQGSAEEHPALEQLVAYHERRLDPTAHECLQDHLTICADCAELVLDLSNFRELRADGAEPAASRVDAAWQELTKRISDAPRPETEASDAQILQFPSTASSSASSDPAPRSWRSRAPPLLAAALAIAVVGLSWQVTTLSKTVADLSGSWANQPIAELVMADERGAPQKEVVRISSDAKILVLRLLVNGPDSNPMKYRGELRRPDGSSIWAVAPLWSSSSQDGYRSFTVGIPCRLLEEGDFRFRITEDNDENVLDYVFRLEIDSAAAP
jgi:hypothetical protein